MGRDVWVEHNEGIISTGDYAMNTMNRVDPGPITPAAEVEAPAGLTGPFHPDALFVGRVAELDAVTAALENDNGVITQAITGLGGIGKSTLARRYALTQRDRHNPIWWLTAETPGRIDAGLAALARRLQPVLGNHTEEAAAQWCRAWLDTHDGWLLVLDNVSRPSDVEEIVGTHTRGRFLITSRQTEGWTGLAVPTRLDVLSPAQARELLDGLVADERLLDGADELCVALGGLPLAIEMAAAYLVQNAVTAHDYLQRLTRSGDAWSWVPAGGDPQRTVGRIWQVTFERIEAEHGPEPGALLRVMAWYAPDGIPPALLRTSLPAETDELAEAIGRLASYGLVTRAEDGVALHRLVQAVNRAGAPHGWQEAAAALESAWHDCRSWAERERLATHLGAAITHMAQLRDQPAAFAAGTRLADLLADVDGFEARAAEHLAVILAEQRRLLGPGHPDVFDTRTAHARVQRRGDAAAVVAMLEEIAAEAARTLGRRSPATLHARVRLVLAYAVAGEDEKASGLARRTIPDAVKGVGPDHRYTMSLRFALFERSRDAVQGWATPMERARAFGAGWMQLAYLLESLERVDGPGAESVLEGLDRMVAFCERAGAPGRAVRPCEALLYWLELQQGPDAAETVAVRSKLAELHLQTRHPKRAIPLYQANLGIGEDRLEALDGLARAYLITGDAAAANDAFEQGLAALMEDGRPDDPATVRYLAEVAETLDEAGRAALAIPWHERIVAARERLGAMPYQMLPARNNLAVAHARAGDFARALELFDDLLPAYREAYGDDGWETREAEGRAGRIAEAAERVGMRTRSRRRWRATIFKGGSP